MSLIVEDGSNVTGAESYISVADADTHHSNLGNASWATLTTTVKEQLLRKSTNYMVQTYRKQWAGVRKFSDQSLDFPRYDVPKFDSPSGYGMYPDYYADDIVPGEVKVACAELALKAYTETLAPDLDRATKREKVGVLEVEYDTNAVQYKRYRAIDNLLDPLLASVGGAVTALARV